MEQTDILHFNNRNDTLCSIEVNYLVGKQYRDRIIILSHPYGPLGGNLRNNVIDSLFHFFSDKGYSVFRFNFCGVGKSSGKTSWTGQSEQDDLVHAAHFAKKTVSSDQAKLYLVGYSYGSVITCSVLERVSKTMHLAGVVALSYPVSVLWALTLFHTTAMTKELCSPSNRVDAVPIYFITGGRDQFSSAKRLQDFVDDLKMGNKKFDVIEDGDHFWFGREPELSEMIYSWISQ